MLPLQTKDMVQPTVASSQAQHYVKKYCTTRKIVPNQRKFYVNYKINFFKDGKMTQRLLSLDTWHLVKINFCPLNAHYTSRTPSCHSRLLPY